MDGLGYSGSVPDGGEAGRKSARAPRKVLVLAFFPVRTLFLGTREAETEDDTRLPRLWADPRGSQHALPLASHLATLALSQPP